MNIPTSKTELLGNLRQTRKKWQALLAQIDEEQMTIPGVVGEWSVKDIIAHIVWAERETIGMLRAQAFVGSELWRLSQDERNAAVFAKNKNRPLDEVCQEADEVFATMVESAAALSVEALLDPDWFTWAPFKLSPIAVIARNSYLHYPEHMAQISDWLEERD